MEKVALFLFITVLASQINAFTCPTGNEENSSKSTVMTDELGNHRIWSKEDRQNLTYCISNRFKELKPVIGKALTIATADWMSSGNIKFIHVPDADELCDDRKGAQTLFRISINTSRRYPYAGRAFFPYDERNTVTFKKSYVEGDFNRLLRLARHELGHVLGLRHEHIRSENPYHENCSEDDLFDDITDYDSASVMHYSSCGGTGTYELSDKDREGIAILY